MIKITAKMIRDAAKHAGLGGNYRTTGALLGISYETVRDWVTGDWPDGDQRGKFKKAYLTAKSTSSSKLQTALWNIVNSETASERDRIAATKELQRLFPVLPDEDAEMVLPQNDAVIVEFVESPHNEG